MAKKINAQFDGERAIEHVRQLAVEIGPRLTGTDGEHKAAAYIRKTFRSFSLRTSFQKFPVDTFASATCNLRVLDGRKWRHLPIQPVGLSGSTPKSGLTAELYFAEGGEPEYYAPQMAGKIVLVCGNINPNDRYKLLAHKPAAIVFIEGHLTDEPTRVNLREETLEAFAKIPVGRIRHLDGVDIIAKSVSKAKLTMVNTRRRSYSLNVIGELTGMQYPDEIVVICGHYDTSRDIPGALDNAAGTAIVIELARVLSAQPSKRTLRFIAFAAEETGLNGSKYYASQLLKEDKRRRKLKSFNDKTDKTDLTRHVLTYNIDVHGAIIGKHAFNYSGTEDLGAAVRLLAKEIGMVASAERGPMSSDGSSLAAIGIPALQFARGGGTGAYLHSSLDDIRLVSPDALAKAGRFSQILLTRYVTTAAAFPFPREIPADQSSALEKYKIKKDNAGKKTPGKTVRKTKRRAAN